MNDSLRTPFQLEHFRHTLACQRDLKQLIKTYDKKFPVIPQLNSGKFWDKKNMRDLKLHDQNPMQQDRVKRTAKLITGEKPRVLNLGSGPGFVEHVIHTQKKERLSNWSGVDISPVSVAYTKKAFPQASFWVEDVLQLKTKTVYEYVIALELMEHIEPQNTFKMLKTCYDMLSKGGKLILSIPLNEELEKIVSSGINPNCHVRVYTPELLTAELEIAGFKVVTQEFLFAFHSFYHIKSAVARVMPWFFKPNNYIVLARKV